MPAWAPWVSTSAKRAHANGAIQPMDFFIRFETPRREDRPNPGFFMGRGSKRASIAARQAERPKPGRQSSWNDRPENRGSAGCLLVPRAFRKFPRFRALG